MADKVVDASALAAVMFGEPDGAAVSDRLRDSRLFAPALLDFELANVCLMKLRRNPEYRSALRAAFALRHRLGIRNVATDHDAALRLAEATGLTAYDASYLWLARTLSVELVTLDRQLDQAASR